MPSKRKERESKECLNCGTIVQGRFCQNCGQENIEQKEPIGRVFLYLIEGFTFFNSKFFKTFIPLLVKPGYLTKEYNKGKRASFLNPTKTYFFLSFLYFLLFFWIGNDTSILTLDPLEDGKKTDISVEDTAKRNKNNITLGFEGNNWFSEKLEKLKSRAYKNGEDVKKELNRLYSSNIPNVIFFVMPFLALILKLFFWRRYFIEHLIHALHIHSFGFLIFIILLFLNLLSPNDGEFFGLVAIVLITTYVIVSLRRVYEQKVGVTILKAFSVLLFYSIVFGVGFFANIIITLVLI